MKLKNIRIQNYRQFIDSTINVEEDITILAGANNSGKTSLIELFKNIFELNTRNFSVDDIPVINIKEWSNSFYLEMEKVFNENDGKENILNKIDNVDFPIMNPISLNIEIGYDNNESISHYADYLMDLDESIKSFFFKYKHDLNRIKFLKNIELNFELLSIRMESIIKDKNAGIKQDDLETRIMHLKDKFLLLYVKSWEGSYWFCDSGYSNDVEMEGKKFKKLFNFNCISANRLIDDEFTDKGKSISKGMINYIAGDEDWSGIIKELPDKIREPIEMSEIKKTLQKKSVDGLNSLIEAIAKTNGGKVEKLVLDMDIDDESIKQLIDNITSAKYIVDGYFLKESAQGLGYSNMVYMHLELENFLKNVDSKLVNFFIIEEPEAHMHPQMQKVFIRYLFEYYKSKSLQGLVTTHSSEIVKVTTIEKLKVIREIKLFQNDIFDMRKFINNVEDVSLKNFYNMFFNLNFSDIIFSDKVVMYEGDTERMYIQKVMQLEKFSLLNDQYIAYIQVGGAYAHSYKKMVNFLNIKSLIITDSDYGEECRNKDEILSSVTTNSAIKSFYKDDVGNNPIDMKAMYEWYESKYKNDFEGNIFLSIQTEKDGYSRTLEEAMLLKFLEMTICEAKSNDDWKTLRTDKNLKFAIPRKTDNINVRDIVKSSSNVKTDFMYSVIIGNMVDKMLPKYIEEGLGWLMK